MWESPWDFQELWEGRETWGFVFRAFHGSVMMRARHGVGERAHEGVEKCDTRTMLKRGHRHPAGSLDRRKTDRSEDPGHLTRLRDNTRSETTSNRRPSLPARRRPPPSNLPAGYTSAAAPHSTAARPLHPPNTPPNPQPLSPAAQRHSSKKPDRQPNSAACGRQVAHLGGFGATSDHPVDCPVSPSAASFSV